LEIAWLNLIPSFPGTLGVLPTEQNTQDAAFGAVESSGVEVTQKTQKLLLFFLTKIISFSHNFSF
jgi:hypothetical protein